MSHDGLNMFGEFDLFENAVSSHSPLDESVLYQSGFHCNPLGNHIMTVDSMNKPALQHVWLAICSAWSLASAII